MNLNNTPTLGPLMADDFDQEPWHLPQWQEQTANERRYHQAAHAATEVGADDDAPTFGDVVIEWMTPRRFWISYAVTFFGAMLAVWVVLS